jgi:hypothetical protein
MDNYADKTAASKVKVKESYIVWDFSNSNYS